MKRLPCVVTASLAVAPGAGRADDEREEKPRFKGVELYSWKDRDGDRADFEKAAKEAEVELAVAGAGE